MRPTEDQNRPISTEELRKVRIVSETLKRSQYRHEREAGLLIDRLIRQLPDSGGTQVRPILASNTCLWF